MADHYIDIVNENDEVIGKELKSKKTELGFISRVSAIFIRDSQGKFIICKRSPDKKYDPNKYDLAACGSLMVGESYEDGARRELEEETGINCKLTMLDKFYEEVWHENKIFKFFCGIFLAQSDQKLKLNEELVSYRKMAFNEIENEILNNPNDFCPGFINDFNRVKNLLS